MFIALVVEFTRSQSEHKGDMVTDNLALYTLKPVQLEREIQIHPRIIELGRKVGKVDVEVYHDGHMVGKAVVTAQLIER